MTAAGVSPSSSPRLPSPPPLTEVQIGPQSPSIGEPFGTDAELLVGGAGDDGSTRRIRPGTRAADMAFGPPLIPLSQVSYALLIVGLEITDTSSSILHSSFKSTSKLYITILRNPKDLTRWSQSIARLRYS